MPWSRPADRMREFGRRDARDLGQLEQRAARWTFRGDFYQHTLMAARLPPRPNVFGVPPVLIAAVGPQMIRLLPSSRRTDRPRIHQLNGICGK